MTMVRRLTKKRVQPEWPSPDGATTVAVTRRLGFLQRVFAAWHAAINVLVPLGYEDEWGFHYGKSPEGKDPSEANAA